MGSMSKQARFIVCAAILGNASLAQSQTTYTVEKDEDGEGSYLVVKSNGKALKGPWGTYVTVEQRRDFNGDGVTDALVSINEAGGNCCPDIYMIVSVSDGEVVTAKLDNEWAEYSVVEENGQLLVKQKTVKETILYRFDGRNAIKVRTIPRLKAIKEINGPGIAFAGDSEKAKVLEADIDLDGKPDTIRCDIWDRWGSLAECTLPLPGGKTQILEYACDRIGVLSSTRNGYREIVCNNDHVIWFDGTAWHTK